MSLSVLRMYQTSTIVTLVYAQIHDESHFNACFVGWEVAWARLESNLQEPLGKIDMFARSETIPLAKSECLDQTEQCYNAISFFTN